jgi:ParB/RepB/Spo0J family partition protein
MAKATTIEQARATDTPALIEYDLLVPAPDNVRGEILDTEDLSESIFQTGLQQPLRVHLLEDGNFQIIAGHRRHHALGLLILEKRWTGPIPCMVADVNISEDDRVASMIVENLQRSDLNPIEEAHAFSRLVKDYGYKQADLALKVGRSASYVSDRISLLKLPEQLIDAVRIGYFPLTIGLLLTQVGDDKAVLDLTKGGRIVPSPAQINDAALKVKHAKLLAEWEAAIEKAGVAVFTDEDRFDMLRKTEVVDVDLSTPKALAKGPLFPPRTKLLVKSEPWKGTVTVEARQFLTEAQLKAKAKKFEQEQADRASAREAEQLARWEKEKAAMSPERQAWVDECEAVREHNDAERKRYAADVDAAERAFVLSVDAKSVARFAMLAVLNDTYAERDACNMLGLDATHVTAAEVLHEYAQQGAKQLVAACIAVMLAEANDDHDDDDPVFEEAAKYLARQNIPEADIRELPAEPQEVTADVDADDDAVA